MTPYERWAYGDDKRYDAWDNFPFQLLMKRAPPRWPREVGKRKEAAAYRQTAEKMAAALLEHMVDGETGLIKGSTHGGGHHSGQYHAGLALWTGLLLRRRRAASSAGACSVRT